MDFESRSAFTAYTFVEALGEPLVHATGARVARLVGSSGLEPPTSCLSGTRSNLLSYEPVFLFACHRSFCPHGSFLRPFARFTLNPVGDRKESAGKHVVSPRRASAQPAFLLCAALSFFFLARPFSWARLTAFSAENASPWWR